MRARSATLADNASGRLQRCFTSLCLRAGPVSRLSATIQHVASRRITAPRLATSLTRDVTVQGKVAQGVMN
jgi:hypothetical protein